MKIKNIFKNIGLLIFSSALMLLLAEFVSWYIVPISPGPKLLTEDGQPLRQSYIKPDTRFRIVTPDFDALTTITPDGYRGPAAKGKPDVVFVGDSFTYAQGVRDEEAFPHLLCQARGLNCANLSVPGASTLYELDRLERYITEKDWRPTQVEFFFFTGNDFGDNLDAAEKRANNQPYEPGEITPELQREMQAKRPLLARIIDTSLKHSNLLRILFYKVKPALENNPEAQQQSLEKSLTIAKGEFERLEKMSKQYGFSYQIYVLYTEPEVKQELYKALHEKLQATTSSPVISIAKLFANDTSRYYFPSDGHFTVEGNRVLAKYLAGIRQYPKASPQ